MKNIQVLPEIMRYHQALDLHTWPAIASQNKQAQMVMMFVSFAEDNGKLLRIDFRILKMHKVR